MEAVHQAEVVQPRELVQVQADAIHTAYIERLNGTFRGRLAVLGRRTRRSARNMASLCCAAEKDAGFSLEYDDETGSWSDGGDKRRVRRSGR